MIAIDTNLLIYAHRTAAPEHLKAQRAIDKASIDPQGWGISLPCLAEFWAVATHPLSAGRPSTASEASRFIHSLIAADAEIWMPGPGFAPRLIQVATELKVRGTGIFDLQIALTAFDNGAHEIWTHDTHFVSIPGLRVKDPLKTLQ